MHVTPRIAPVFLAIVLVTQAVAQEPDKPSTLAEDTLGKTNNVHSFGKNLLCGQPSEEDFAEAKQRGIERVITLRTEGEVAWDEQAVVKALGMEFYSLGFDAPDTLSDEILDKSLGLLAEAPTSAVMLHCGSANRVGAIWLAHRVLNDKLSVADAQAEAKTVGLRAPGLEEKALDYIQRKQAAGKPGINDNFIDPSLDVDEWIARFEVESREVFAARERVLAACGIKPGYAVADVGAGTGFYSRLFAGVTGPAGWVFSVDISPRFLEHINQRFEADSIANLTTVLCSNRSARLPPNSVDLVFICDTYHHFEYPASTMASILAALKPNGRLVLIDFERIPGVSREFLLGHVRAGKNVVKQEIIDVGFEFEDELKVPEFKENYLLRFKKK